MGVATGVGLQMVTFLPTMQNPTSPVLLLANLAPPLAMYTGVAAGHIYVGEPSRGYELAILGSLLSVGAGLAGSLLGYQVAHSRVLNPSGPDGFGFFLVGAASSAVTAAWWSIGVMAPDASRLAERKAAERVAQPVSSPSPAP